MARTISRRERLLLLGAAALLGVVLLARPHLAKLSQIGPGADRLLAEKVKVIAAYRQTVDREDGFEQEAEDLEGDITGYEQALLPGATPPLAAADLQTRLKQLADRSGLRIQSEKILAHVKRDAYLEIPVQIVASGDIRNVKDFLVALEASPTFIAVQELSLRAGVARRRAPNADPRLPPDGQDIQAGMTLVGLIRSER